jgi:hypothetical protein
MEPKNSRSSLSCPKFLPGPTRKGEVDRLMAFLRIQNEIGLLDLLHISPSTLGRWRYEGITNSWLLSLFAQYNISPLWIIDGECSPKMEITKGYHPLPKKYFRKSQNDCLPRIEYLFTKKYVKEIISENGYSESYIRKIKTGHKISATFLISLCHRFGVNPLWIVNNKLPAIISERRIELFRSIHSNLQIYETGELYARNIICSGSFDYYNDDSVSAA